MPDSRPSLIEIEVFGGDLIDSLIKRMIVMAWISNATVIADHNGFMYEARPGAKRRTLYRAAILSQRRYWHVIGKPVAELMREWRTLADLNATAAGDRLGLSSRAIEDIEQGRRRADDELSWLGLLWLIAETERKTKAKA